MQTVNNVQIGQQGKAEIAQELQIGVNFTVGLVKIAYFAYT